MTVVSMEEVVKALSNTMGKKGMSLEDLEKLAEYILSFFGYTDEVIDNRLTSEDRDVFYMLEEEGFLTTTQEEVHLKKGKLWRIHYWILKKDQIKRVANIPDEVPLDPNDPKTLYTGMAEDVWEIRER
ncbi:MAG TPA: DUF6015 family protein [Methanomassiliicoccales archaeon]|nr:DUF6015 family protein [Methanomassiliicoccales archaeon]